VCGSATGLNQNKKILFLFEQIVIIIRRSYALQITVSLSIGEVVWLFSHQKNCLKLSKSTITLSDSDLSGEVDHLWGAWKLPNAKLRDQYRDPIQTKLWFSFRGLRSLPEVALYLREGTKYCTSSPPPLCSVPL
jgi:hypothetical protein